MAVLCDEYLHGHGRAERVSMFLCDSVRTTGAIWITPTASKATHSSVDNASIVPTSSHSPNGASIDAMVIGSVAGAIGKPTPYSPDSLYSC